MFERNRVDNAHDPTVAVEITLAGGETISGRAKLAKGKAIHRLLDGEDRFLYVKGFDGEAQFIAKAEIKAVKVISTKRPRALSPRHPTPPVSTRTGFSA